MKTKLQLQIQIAPIVSGISVKCPFHPLNNADYKKLRGKFDKEGRRWILPDNDDSWDLLDTLFGAKGQIVVAAVDRKHLATTGNQCVLKAYLVAKWDTFKNCICMAEGVLLVEGAWDEAASATAQAPCLTPTDAKFHVVVRREFALKNGLAIIEELGEEILTNPLSAYAFSDLEVELRNRGYRIQRSLF